MATYWLTLRLADAMPKERMTEIKEQAAAIAEEEGGDDAAKKRTLARLIEEEMNRWHGDCWLRDDEVARTVVAALQAGHGRKYTLRAWCLLPNHVQVVFSVAEGVDAGAVVREWSNYTTRQVNILVGREGEVFWEKMPYLKACMDDAEVLKRVRGVEFRPVNGGLCQRPRDWKWSSARQSGAGNGVARGDAGRTTPGGRTGTAKPTRPADGTAEDEGERDPFA